MVSPLFSLLLVLGSPWFLQLSAFLSMSDFHLFENLRFSATVDVASLSAFL